MAEGSVNVTEGSGKRFHTWDRTISGVLVQSQGVFIDEFPYATYSVTAQNVSLATSSDHVLQLMAGSSNYVRIRKITLEQATNATAAGSIRLTVLRLTTAGTGGTAVTARPFDSGDAAAGAAAMTLPTVKGTEGVTLGTMYLTLRQAVGASGAVADDVPYSWVSLPNQKSIIIPTGTANGIALKVGTGVAGATCEATIEFVETAWLGA